MKTLKVKVAADIVSVPVYGSVKPKGQSGNLYHAVERNSDGDFIRVLCKRVKLEHTMHDDATWWNAAPVSCPQCVSAVKKMGRNT